MQSARYVRACDVAELNDGVIDVISEHGRRIVSPISTIALWQMGGAAARIGEDETSFSGRSAGFAFNINGNTYTAEGFDAEREWAQTYWSALAPYQSSVYVNFLMDEGERRVRQAYGPAKFDRLKALKHRYDPDNVSVSTRTSAPTRASLAHRSPMSVAGRSVIARNA
jgi:hypothetical protein